MQHPIPFPVQPERIRLEDAIVDWQRYLKAMGHPQSTIKRYVCQVRKFQRWLPVQMLNEVQPYHIKRFRDELGQTLAPGTVNQALCALSSLFAWAVDEAECLESNPAAKIKRPKISLPPPKDLTDEEKYQLFRAIEYVGRESWQSDYPSFQQQWMRNRRAIFLALYAGLRISELIALRWSDVDMTRCEVRVVSGKGGKHRTVPMHPDLYQELSMALDKTAQRFVVGKPDGSPISVKTASHIFDQWLVARGLAITCHQLRHTFATSLMYSGVPLREIQVALGHDSIETTQRYLGVSGAHLQDSIAKPDYSQYKPGSYDVWEC
jgi:integrase